MKKQNDSNLVIVYIPGKGLTEVSKEQASKITAPIIKMQQKRKAEREARKKQYKKKKHRFNNKKTA